MALKIEQFPAAPPPPPLEVPDTSALDDGSVYKGPLDGPNVRRIVPVQVMEGEPKKENVLDQPATETSGGDQIPPEKNISMEMRDPGDKPENVIPEPSPVIDQAVPKTAETPETIPDIARMLRDAEARLQTENAQGFRGAVLRSIEWMRTADIKNPNVAKIRDIVMGVESDVNSARSAFEQVRAKMRGEKAPNQMSNSVEGNLITAARTLRETPDVVKDIENLRGVLKEQGLDGEMLSLALADKYGPDLADPLQKLIDNPTLGKRIERISTLGLSPDVEEKMVGKILEQLENGKLPKNETEAKIDTKEAKEADDGTEAKSASVSGGASSSSGSSGNVVNAFTSLLGDITPVASGNMGSAEGGGGATETRGGSAASPERAASPEQLSQVEGSLETNMNPMDVHELNAEIYAQLLTETEVPKGQQRNVEVAGQSGETRVAGITDRYSVSSDTDPQEALQRAQAYALARMQVSAEMVKADKSDAEDKIGAFEAALQEKFGAENVQVTKIEADGVPLKAWTEGMRVKTEMKDGKIVVTFEDAGNVQRGLSYESEVTL